MRGAGMVLGALLMACATAGTPPAATEIPAGARPLESAPISGLERSTFSGIDAPTFAVIRDPREWREFWHQLTAHQIPRRDVPAIDFTERMVVVTAMGRKPTGGHAIRIAGVHRAGGGSTSRSSKPRRVRAA